MRKLGITLIILGAVAELLSVASIYRAGVAVVIPGVVLMGTGLGLVRMKAST